MKHLWDKFLTDRDRQVFEAAGYGSRAGFGKKPALLVIDVNYNFCGDKREPIFQSIKRYRNSCGEDAWDALPVIKMLIDACHDNRVPVIYSTGTIRTDGWDRGGWGWKNTRNTEDFTPPDSRGNNRNGNDIMDEIAPESQDIIIEKLKPSAFHGTNLNGFLYQLGGDSLLITGTTTSGCVRATVIDAFSFNIRSTIAAEACFDRSQASHAISLCDMNAKYADVVSADEVLAHINTLSDVEYNLPTGK